MVEKKRRRKPKDPSKVDKRFNENPQGGRPKVEDGVLTEDMKAFAEYIGRGMTAKMAGDLVQFSEYQWKTYPTYENVKREIEKFRQIYQIEGDKERWIAIYDNMAEEAFIAIGKKIRKGDISESFLKDILAYKMYQVGVDVAVPELKQQKEMGGVKKKKQTAIEERTYTQPKAEEKKVMKADNESLFDEEDIGDPEDDLVSVKRTVIKEEEG